MKVASADEMRSFDRRAVEEFGVPGIVLMENAGRHVFEAARHLLGDPCGKRVAIVAGRGNNGGDGFVAARHLRDAGAQVTVHLAVDPSEVKGDAGINLAILTKTGLPVVRAEGSEDLSGSDLIIDALLGTGLRGEVRGLAVDLIERINSAGVPVVSVDIPSGLDADTGRILGTCVRADCTVTFALPKIGLLTYPGAAAAGRLVVGEIGIPHRLYEELAVELVEACHVADLLPERPCDAHKGTFGTVLTLAGSLGLTGAAAMASEAALRIGAGLSTLGVPASLQDLMAVKLTEVMTRALPETEERSLAEDALSPALELSEKADAVVLGCGLGTHPETCAFVRSFIGRANLPVVVDADGLNCLAGSGALEKEHAELVLTPHPGEMGRLLGTDTASVQADRFAAAREAASRFRSVVVLKGARTLIADPSGRVWINPTGGPALATGGTGDVLAGAIGGLLAQGLSRVDAAVCGVYLHGLAGEIIGEQIGAGALAGDLLRALPKAMQKIRRV
ncbi:MAG: NAD(P)H-hydrate dehydratase [Armatimonadota bacterium]